MQIMGQISIGSASKMFKKDEEVLYEHPKANWLGCNDCGAAK